MSMDRLYLYLYVAAWMIFLFSAAIAWSYHGHGCPLVWKFTSIGSVIFLGLLEIAKGIHNRLVHKKSYDEKGKA